MVSRLSTLEFV